MNKNNSMTITKDEEIVDNYLKENEHTVINK